MNPVGRERICYQTLLMMGLCIVGPSLAEAQERVHTVEIFSPAFQMDREYRSMQGPSDEQVLLLSKNQPPELLWITGYRAVMIDSQSQTPMPQELMCHSSLSLIDAKRYRTPRQGDPYPLYKLFTLSQGQISIQFPDGFGIPVMSDENFLLATQALNLNPQGNSLQVKHRVFIDFLRDRELQKPMKPLFLIPIAGIVSLESPGTDWQTRRTPSAGEGSQCLMAEAASAHIITDPRGRRFTGHWIVKPGRWVNHNRVTDRLGLLSDTTVHYICVHLHPFAESLELRDRTTGQIVFKSHARNFSDRIGLERVEHFSGPKGIPLHKDHEYELIMVYNNTSSSDQDAMAVMYLYLLDKQFRKA